MPKWVKRWGYELSEKPVRPGVYRIRTGGFYLRALVTNEGKRQTVSLVSHEEDKDKAYLELRAAVARANRLAARSPTTSFGEYSVSLLERKAARGELRSAQTRKWWADTLKNHLLPAFQHLDVREIRRTHLEAWKDGVARRISEGELSPRTANGWLRLVKVILNSAVAEFELERNPTFKLKGFDVSMHPTYTHEEPNSLELHEVPRFLTAMRERFPQFYAFTFLGLATGMRPSHMLALRRCGPEADVLWEDGVILMRRSYTVGEEAMARTKTGKNLRIPVPEELLVVLRWHEREVLFGPMLDSELLFPSELGGFRGETTFARPFRRAAELAGITKKITPRAMRRTFQDLARAAEVKDVITRAISGHMDEKMQELYSTYSDKEKLESVSRIVKLALTTATNVANGFKEAVGAGLADAEAGRTSSDEAAHDRVQARFLQS